MPDSGRNRSAIRIRARGSRAALAIERGFFDIRDIKSRGRAWP
jgi:hypothetical protein